VIGRLAVSRGHAGKGVGADILADALRRIAIASQSLGIAAVLVHAKDEAAKRFYLRCAEFIEYPADGRTLSPHRDRSRGLRLSLGGHAMRKPIEGAIKNDPPRRL
jgi:hypothetical protein